jgi:CheY-like chemotaxis protein
MIRAPGPADTILVVDDDLALGEAIASALQAMGYRVQHVRDGLEALTWLRAQPTLPALILLDWMLPIMGGLEFLAHQASDPRLASVPVVVMSIAARSAPIPRLSVAAILPKPFGLRSLIDVVDRLCALPARPEVDVELPEPAPPRRILVVDDDDEIRDAVIEALGRHGYEGIGARNGRDALDQLAAMAAPPALIVLDWMMPVMSGLELLEAMIADGRFGSIPVLTLSAFPTPRATPEGAVAATLHKPVRLRTMLDVIGRLTASSGNAAP